MMQPFMASARLPPSSIILRRSTAVAVGVGPSDTGFGFGFVGADSVVVGDAAGGLVLLPPMLLLSPFSSSFLDIGDFLVDMSSCFGKLTVVEDGEFVVFLADVVTKALLVVVEGDDVFAVVFGPPDEVAVDVDVACVVRFAVVPT
jgi:hypothetical protein